jgi:hypothetical protein
MITLQAGANTHTQTAPPAHELDHCYLSSARKRTHFPAYAINYAVILELEVPPSKDLNN